MKYTNAHQSLNRKQLTWRGNGAVTVRSCAVMMPVGAVDLLDGAVTVRSCAVVMPVGAVDLLDGAVGLLECVVTVQNCAVMMLVGAVAARLRCSDRAGKHAT